QYRANTEHPLYPDLKNIVHKYVGFDKIVDFILSKLGKVYYAFIVGDYARGMDSGMIEMVIVGDVDKEYLRKCVKKVEKLINRKISTKVLEHETFVQQQPTLGLETALVMWSVK